MGTSGFGKLLVRFRVVAHCLGIVELFHPRLAAFAHDVRRVARWAFEQAILFYPRMDGGRSPRVDRQASDLCAFCR
jgi:hypothetical protein